MDSFTQAIGNVVSFATISKASILMATWPLQRYVIMNQTRPLQTQTLPYSSIFTYSIKSLYLEKNGYFRGSFASLSYYFGSNVLKGLIYPVLIRSVFYKQPNSYEEQVIKENIITALAHLFCGVGLYPLDRARTLVSCEIAYKDQALTYKNSINCLTKMYDMDGFKGLYRGFWLGFSHFTLSVWVTHYLKYYISVKNPFDDVLTKIFAFVATNAVGAFVAYPLLVLTRRRQLCDGKTFINEPLKISQQISKIWKEEGLRGFYRGIWMAGINGMIFTSILVSLSLYNLMH